MIALSTKKSRSIWRKFSANNLFRAQADKLYRRIDILFASLLLAQWLGCCIWASLFCPYTYVGIVPSMHPHVTTALFFGGLITLFPCFLVINAPTTPLTRHTIAIAQTLMSSLIIHISGGRIEAHFHIFGSLAFLAFYRDWTVLVTATIVITIDHFFRGIYYPQSVYGITTASISRTIEHAFWIIFEDIFLIYSCILGRREMMEIAARRAELEQTNATIEEEVKLRTQELAQATELLQIKNVDLEHKNHQIEFERQSALAANHAKSAFLANMSHELRTPLTAILGYAEIISEPEETQVVQEASQAIIRNGRHLLAILNDILDISKIDANKIAVENEPCSPREIAESVIELLKVRADEKKIALNLHVRHNVPETIRSDTMRIRQILINLAGNAIKFTDKGSVSIDVHIDNSARKLFFDVSDSGIGIPPEHQTRLFREFEQADNSVTRKYGGTGLGLAIAKRLARLLNGDAFLLQSIPELGSTFRLELPLDPQPSISENLASSRMKIS